MTSRRPASLLGVGIVASGIAQLTCAKPIAPAANVGAVTAAPPAAADDGAPTPLPKRPPAPPTQDFPEVRPIQVLFRDVADGFETLVAGTSGTSGCWGWQDTGGEVQIEGARDPRRPWSGWFHESPGGPIPGAAEGTAGFLFLRRPLP